MQHFVLVLIGKSVEKFTLFLCLKTNQTFLKSEKALKINNLRLKINVPYRIAYLESI